MKSITKFFLAILTFSLVFCLSGCKNGKSEAEYKSAISQHMQNEHNSRVTSYQSFSIHDEGGASASVNVAATLEGGIGSTVMTNELSVDENGNIFSCDWCDLGIG